jgi:hypothetical protein
MTFTFYFNIYLFSQGQVSIDIVFQKQKVNVLFSIMDTLLITLKLLDTVPSK